MRDRAVHPMQRADGSWVTFPMEPHCVPCWLFGWTSREVRVFDDNYTLGGSPSEIEAEEWRWELGARGHQVTRQSCNSTENTAATSMWLPVGCPGPDPFALVAYLTDQTPLDLWLWRHR